jgi:hypothetical protein
VVTVSTEGGDKEGRVIVEGVVPGDGEQEISLNIFVLRTPDLLTTFVDDGVLVGVVSDGGGTRQGDEEVRKKLGFWGDREWEIR